MKYFKNLVESPNAYQSDIIRNTLAILEKALKYAGYSMDMFTHYQKTNDEGDWRVSMEYDKRARGLLDAYQIITGREVVNIMSSIRQEIDVYKELFL